jgi:branched-chain amino acid transport system substrate-binding protein
MPPDAHRPFSPRRRPGVMAALATAAAALAVAACGGSSGGGSSSSSGSTSADKSPIVVGAAVARSGLASPFDQPPLNSFKLAMKQINAEGGIDGRRIELIEGDTQSDIGRTPAVATDLIARKAQVLLVTCDYDFGAPAANVAQQKGLVSFSLCATSPKFGVQGVGDKAYSPAASIGNEAAALATYAIQQGWTKADLMLDPSLAYTRGLCKAFESFYKQLGGSVVGRQPLRQDGVSTGPQVNRLRSSGAQVALMCTYPPGGASVVRAIRAAGVDMPLMSGNSFGGAFWVKAAPGISDFYVVTNTSTFGDDPNPAVNKLVQQYVEAYGEQPSTTQAVMGYSIAQMLKEAIGKAKSTDGAAVAAQLDKLSNFPTMSGSVTYTATDHIPLNRELEIVRFTKGKPQFVQKVTPKVKVTLADGAA